MWIWIVAAIIGGLIDGWHGALIGAAIILGIDVAFTLLIWVIWILGTIWSNLTN